MSAERDEKVCEHCGRPFANRRRWSSREVWDEVRYCSRRCRSEAASARRRARRSGDS